MTRRRASVLAAQIALFVVVFGGWQLFTSLKIVDPFFFGQPSGIVHQAWAWVRHGTNFGSIWEQIWTTMEEAIFGFFIGVAAGVVVGALLGQVRFLSEQHADHDASGHPDEEPEDGFLHRGPD